LQKCSVEELSSVGFMDRKDLLDYILGLNNSVNVKMKDSILLGFDLYNKRDLLSSELLDFKNLISLNSYTRYFMF
jgi:hypothetical protein